MNEKLLYGSSVVLSGVALLLLLIHMIVVGQNQSLRQEVNVRQATINNAMNLSQFNQALVNALAEETIKHSDQDIRNLLTSQGIKISETNEAKQPEKK